MFFFKDVMLMNDEILVFVGCYKITTVFSHAQTVVLCVGCNTVLCQPTGGKARLTEGMYSCIRKVMQLLLRNASPAMTMNCLVAEYYFSYSLVVKEFFGQPSVDIRIDNGDTFVYLPL